MCFLLFSFSCVVILTQRNLSVLLKTRDFCPGEISVDSCRSVCVCVCVYVCMPVCVCVSVYARNRVLARACVFASLCVGLSMYTYICLHYLWRLRRHVCMCVCVRVCVCVYIFIRVRESVCLLTCA